jgi:hypothetical protein
MAANQGKTRKDYALPAARDGRYRALMGPAKPPETSRPLLLSQLAISATDDSKYYHRDCANILAEIAAWAYSDCETLLDALHHRGIVGPGTTCHQISVSNEAMLVVATAFVIRSGGIGVLCFRGTEPTSAINFLTDVNVHPKDFLSMGHVHGGFHRNVRAVWSDIAEQIQDAIDDTNEQRKLQALYITGHSLGAAMAVVGAATIFGDDAFAAWRPLVRGIYTYGQPMVGDKEFAKTCEPRFGDMLFRHVYEHDIVARMPPLTTGRFEHFGKEYYGNEKGWSPRSGMVSQAKTVALSVPIGGLAFLFKQIPILSSIRLPFSIDDHSPNSYLEAFRAARS